MFMNELVLERYGKDRWRVHVRLLWNAGQDVSYCVPEGFVTDLASFPRFLWWLPGFNPNGRSRRPAVLHDWLYTAAIVDRKQADQIFRQALIEDGVKPWLAGVFYRAVRWFGHGEFKRRRLPLGGRALQGEQA